ncbi:MAG: succinyldiaminopimelate transaminase, partial [Betaproteobacteria bacterium]|nr:succinyldiaminopimelate transaminase [Betaproteobacteria bacterium]
MTTLQAYPFERLRALFADIAPNPALAPISLGIGEPRHPTPALIMQAMAETPNTLSTYPATGGLPALRTACADWLKRRYAVSV